MSEYTIIIVGSTLGFFALAAALLIPVYRFLKREEALSEELDKILVDELRRRNAKKATNGTRWKDGTHRDDAVDDDDGGVGQPRP